MFLSSPSLALEILPNLISLNPAKSNHSLGGRGVASSPFMQRLYVFTCKLLVEPIPLGPSKCQHGGDAALHLLRDSILHDKGRSFC